MRVVEKCSRNGRDLETLGISVMASVKKTVKSLTGRKNLL